MTRSVYLILGMHRSGTSALSRVVVGAGASLPKTPLPPDRYNSRGYFESGRIAQLNAQRLHALGSAWDDVFAFPAAPLPEATERQWQAQARALMAEEFGEASDCLLKDPRITLLLPAWRQVFAGEGRTPRCVVALRDPLAVAASLAHRDLFNTHKSVLLWTTYMLAAAGYTRDLPTVCVAYDALLTDWRSQLARVEAAHGLPAAGLGADEAAAIDSFLSAELSHHSPVGELADLGWIGEMAAEVNAWWREAAEDRRPDHARLRQVAEKLDMRRRELGPLVSPISHQLDAARTRIVMLSRELAARERAKGGAGMTAGSQGAVGPLVSFLVIGVQKGGTTALHHYLSEDPNIAMSLVKETHFFDDERRDWSRPDYRPYHASFPDPQGRPCGEATPIYSYWPPCLERIAAYNPAMRLILLLRDPVERAWSHWRMEYARGAETQPFAWCIRQGRERLLQGTRRIHHRVFSYVERGFYAEQLDRILALFPRRQLLVLRSEALRSDPGATLSQVRAFVGAPQGPSPAPRLVHVGRAMDYGVGVTLADIDLLRERYAADDRRLLAMSGISFAQR